MFAKDKIITHFNRATACTYEVCIVVNLFQLFLNKNSAKKSDLIDVSDLEEEA